MRAIDGAEGEGGGQILRTALAVSLITGEAFELTNIRARRKRGGLLAQHLAAVRAATAVGEAEVHGDTLESMHLIFRPKRITPGHHQFSVGTAGSAMLVLQTVLPPLLLADQPSKVRVEGGTHNPASPAYDFFERTFLPQLARMGADVRAKLIRPGFYPRGGGIVEAEIKPTGRWKPFTLLERGDLLYRRAVARVAGLSPSIAQREIKTFLNLAGWAPSETLTEVLDDRFGPGNVFLAELVFREVTEIASGFGERRVPAEAVAESVATAVKSYLALSAPVGEHLADQLLLPLAIGAGGTFHTVPLTSHTATQIDTLRRFLNADVATTAREDGSVDVVVRR
ncbi:MAG: RNA 3'-terminal phosphate cyclase [Deltaproteobacteria bacterium]|nr:RNA 3'-terminal phosphate cyclase [Deltaproteobacteria bacterium]